MLTTETEESVTANLQTNTDLSNLTAQVATGGSVAPVGRAELDPVLQTPIYLVPSEDGQRPRMVSQMLLQDVVVLQMGNFPTEAEEEAARKAEEQAAAEAEAAPEGGEEAPPPPIVKPDVVTLIVTPQDAVTLNYLMFSGAELTLALRNIYDPDRLVVNPVTLQFLLEQYQIPVPVRLPYGFQPRVDDVRQPVLRNDIPAQ